MTNYIEITYQDPCGYTLTHTYTDSHLLLFQLCSRLLLKILELNLTRTPRPSPSSEGLTDYVNETDF